MDPPTSLKQKKYLFTDFRHIQCGFLEWFSPDGKLLPLTSPPEPPVKARAGTGMCAQGVRLVAQRPTKGEPLQQRKGNPGGRIMYDQGVYRSWHLAVSYPPREDFGGYSQADPQSVEICYFESNDAVEWIEVNRSAIEVPGQTAFDGVAFFIDPNGRADERYKVVYTAQPPESEWPALFEQHRKLHPRYQDIRIAALGLQRCIYAAVSPEGLNWKAVPMPIMIHLNDTDTSVYYDTWLDRYVMYGRLSVQDRRWIGRAETEDFYHWGPMQPLIKPRLDWHFSDDIYLNAYTRYPGLPEYHLMFPMVYHRNTEGSDVHMFSSSDGISWSQVPGSPVLAPDPAGADSEFISVGKDLVPLGGDRIGVRYSGSSKPHKYPRWPNDTSPWTGFTAWAWWPTDRICAVQAKEEGRFWTFPMVSAGRTLKVNVRTHSAGEVRVGVIAVGDEAKMDADRPEGIDWLQAGLKGIAGRSVVDCDPIVGDHAGTTVTWQGQSDIGTHETQRVLLQFTLRAAELFAFEWEVE